MAYIVKKGDNLTKIAKQNGLNLKQLLSLNKNIENPDYIQIGQKINLGAKSPTGKSAYDNNDGYPTTPVKKNTPTWDKTTKGAGIPATVANFNETPEKKAPIKKQVTQKEEPGFLDSMKNKIYEIYQDAITAIDQQTSKKVVAKPKVKINDSFIDYGYKELGTYKDQSFKAGKNDSLLSAMNVFDNDKGFDYIVSPKIKEGSKTYKNVKGVAHFLMDSDITPNQKYVDPYNEKSNKQVKSAVKGKFIPYVGTNPTDYVMYYKNIGEDKVNVKYGQLKDKDKYKGYEQMKLRSIPFSELDFNKKTDAGFLKKASYINTKSGKPTSIITDPESNDVYGRFSGGSGIFYFKEPKTGKTISVDVSGSVNTIKKVGEELSKKYNVDPKQLQFLYHDMGSYSAKPKSHNGVLSNEQWRNYNTNNKGYSGAALMYPMKYGGNVIQPSPSESTKLVKNEKYIVDDANDYRLNLLEQTSEDYMKGWINSPMYKKMFDKSKQEGEYPIPENWITVTNWGRKPLLKEEGVAGNYNSHSDSLYIKNNILTNKYQSYATGVHEISHSSDNSGDRIPINDVKKMKDYAKIDREKYYKELPWYKKFLYDETELNNYVKEDLDFKKYVGSPTETRARLNVIRALGKKQGIYDPYISPINSKQLKKIKFENDGYNPMDQLKLIYSEEEILDMLNSISQNNSEKIIQGKFGTTAETIYSMSELPKVILTPDDIKAESGFNFQKYFPMERDIPVDSITSYNRDIDRFAWRNTLQNLTEIQKQQQLPNQQIDSSYYTQKTPKGYLNVYDKSNRLIGYSMDNKTIVKQEPNFEDGGIIKAWIQKFITGGKVYADEGFPGGQELTQPTTNYYNWGNYGNQNSFLTPDQINQKPFQNPYQNMNLQQPNVPQFNIPKGQEIEPLTSIGAQKMTPDLQGIRNRVNQSMQDIAPESKSPMNMNAVNMGLDVGTKALDATANLMATFGKEDSKIKAAGEGGQRAMGIAKTALSPLESVPGGKIISKVGQGLAALIAMPLAARTQAIRNKEEGKREDELEYAIRNTPAVNAPSFYGQTMSKYGSNIKNLEQRLIDDIFSDYDKFMKLT